MSPLAFLWSTCKAVMAGVLHAVFVGNDEHVEVAAAIAVVEEPPCD
jgi:pyruvate/2-oxoglutarate dehydrogenase complex dihydrolipoamide acyltransferase (E2) component